MTKLSVNVNKVALLRNSRLRDYPSVIDFAHRCIDHGAHGITIHPRPDQRHARYADVPALKACCDARSVEFNVEGYPSEAFLEAVLETRPSQCTLVPDAPNQVTSDHGWAVAQHSALLHEAIDALKGQGIRTSVFVDHGTKELPLLHQMGCDRIELYTEPYASSYHNPQLHSQAFESFRQTAEAAQDLGLAVNAGHDLNLENIEKFLEITGILEVSIGHALLVESIYAGLENTIRAYIHAINRSMPAIP